MNYKMNMYYSTIFVDGTEYMYTHLRITHFKYSRTRGKNIKNDLRDTKNLIFLEGSKEISPAQQSAIIKGAIKAGWISAPKHRGRAK